MGSPIPRHFSLFVSDGFSMLALSSITSALKTTNSVPGGEEFTWPLVSRCDDNVMSRCGVDVTANVRLVDGKPENFNRDHIIVVLCGDECDADEVKSLAHWIRSAVSRGAKVGGVGRVGILLAELGLLESRKCAPHWWDYAVCVERFPEVVFRGPISKPMAERFWLESGSQADRH